MNPPNRMLLGIGVAVLLILALVMNALERSGGRADERERAAAAAAIRQHRAFLAQRARADSVERIARRERDAARLEAAKAAAARAATDTAAAALARLRDSSIALARDSAATPIALRREILRLAESEANLLARLKSERLAFASDSAAQARALARAFDTIAEKNAALTEAANMHDRDEEEKAALRAQRPGILRRAATGIIAAVAGVGCGAAGNAIAGPLGAIGGAVACAGLAGAAVR